ncbi:hypothetical protein V6N12_019719 [Hibiscus sabdariffa]|uniref:Uncharacterized protein n=1 Tax=Hibiscus sabdariffa TaxID=183260 RepID=A0ABR2B549_9ROSI
MENLLQDDSIAFNMYQLNKRCSAFSLPILPTLVIDGALVGLHVQDKVEASSLEGSRKRLVFPRRYF